MGLVIVDFWGKMHFSIGKNMENLLKTFQTLVCMSFLLMITC